MASVCCISRLLVRPTAVIVLVLFTNLVSFASCYFIHIDADASECFYDQVKAGTKMTLTFEVVEGGFLDIDVKVTGPDGRAIYHGQKETAQRFTFAAHMDGAYTYCFNNQMSTMTPKVVMFNMDVGNEPGAAGGSGAHANKLSPEEENQEHNKLETMIGELSQALHTVKREQEYMTVRERIHRGINDNTNSRVVLWAFFEATIIVLMTIGQVFYLKRFFEVRRVV